MSCEKKRIVLWKAASKKSFYIGSDAGNDDTEGWGIDADHFKTWVLEVLRCLLTVLILQYFI